MSTLPNFLPPLDSATEAALRESISRFGVIVPVVVDQNGNILDGHHRSRIANDLGIQVFRRSVTVRDEQEARELVADVNDHRRPRMSPEHRREVVRALREQGHSTRAIGRAVGADPKQVRRDIAGGDMSPPAEVQGTDGKRYPASRPAPTKVVQPAPPECEIPGQTTVDDQIEARPAERLADPGTPGPDAALNGTPEERAAHNERASRYSATRLIANTICPLRLHPATREDVAETVALLDATHLTRGEAITAANARHVAAVLNLVADTLEGDLTA